MSVTASRYEPGLFTVREPSGKETQWSVGDRYTVTKPLGEGSFSCVCLCTDNVTGEQVAIKRVGDVLNSLENAKHVTREVCILRRLRHSHITRLHDVFLKPASTGKFVVRDGKMVAKSFDVYIVMEFCSQGDLFHLRGQMTEWEVKTIMWDILKTLHFLHTNGVWHRDVKSANVMLSLRNGRRIAKLADFGSARSARDVVLPEDLHKPAVSKSMAVDKPLSDDKPMDQEQYLTAVKQKLEDGQGQARRFPRPDDPPGAGTGFESPLTRTVCTPCYRAPEVVMSRGGYTSSIDMWSTGCIMGELLQRVVWRGHASTPHLQVAPVFAIRGLPRTPEEGDHFDGPWGRSATTYHELNALFEIIGTPSWACVDALPSHAWRQYLKKIPARAPKLMRRFGAAGEPAVDLLARLLAFDPSRRCSAEEALGHEYFDEIRELQGYPKVRFQPGVEKGVPATAAAMKSMGGDSSKKASTACCNGAVSAAIAAAAAAAATIGVPSPLRTSAPAEVPAGTSSGSEGMQVETETSPGRSMKRARNEVESMCLDGGTLPFYQINDPARALEVLERELSTICHDRDEDEGSEKIREILERESEQQQAILADSAKRPDSLDVSQSTLGPGGYLSVDGEEVVSPPGGFITMHGEKFRTWQHLQPDPGSTAIDPCMAGKDRIPHTADCVPEGVEPETHLRPNRHGEWEGSLISGPHPSGCASGASGQWGVCTGSEGLDESTLRAIRLQQQR